MAEATEIRYRARWVYPVVGEPIEDGVVTVVAGRIGAVGRRSSEPVVDLGDVALLPGFVNAHTHLDISLLRGRIPHPESFADWLEAVVASRVDADARVIDATIREALDELLTTGTTLVGDIATSDASATCSGAVGLPAVVFREVLGWRPQRYESLWQAAVESLDRPEARAPASDESRVRMGISPHAPYSTSPEIYSRAGKLPASVPIATHWLETVEELEFVRTGRGPLRDFMERIGAFDDRLAAQCDWPIDPWQCLLGRGGTNRWILVHANQLDEADIERMANEPFRERIAGVVYCPRTHAYFGHSDHPWRRLNRAGIPVALGTDSLASNPDLSVFEEGRFVAANDSEASPAAVLKLLTLGGACVLGRSGQSGSLEPGKDADLVVVDPGLRNPGDLPAALLDSEAKVVGTMVRGRWRFGPTSSG